MPKSQDSIFIKLLKEYTNIDTDFINTFFKKFKIGGELDFDINENDVCKYLNISILTLRKRLNNVFSKTKRFFEKVDYIKTKVDKTNKIIYMVNYSCFEKLAMSGDSKESEAVRMYFTKLREFITNNQQIIYQAVDNKENLKTYNKFETIYFFAVDERKEKDTFKIGTSEQIINRLRTYNVGRIKEVELKYLALVKNSLIIEKCMKLKLKKNQVLKNKEIYKLEASKIKKIIDECYCKYVSMKENEELYQEISDLLGLYAYTKDKINIKPYIIIGKNL
jgi:hypothetical protein